MGRLTRHKTRIAVLAAATIGLVIPILTTCENDIDLKGTLEVEVMKSNDRYLEVTKIDIPSASAFSPTGTITVYFDRPVNAATINAETVIIQKSDGSRIDYPLSGVEYVESSRSARIRVYPYLPLNSDLSITISGVKGVDGSEIHDIASMTFTTQNILAGSLLTVTGADPLSRPEYSVTPSLDLDLQVNNRYQYFSWDLCLGDDVSESAPWVDSHDVRAFTSYAFGKFSLQDLDISGLAGYQEGEVTLNIWFKGNDTGAGEMNYGLTDSITIFIDSGKPSVAGLTLSGGTDWTRDSTIASVFSSAPVDTGSEGQASGLLNASFSNDNVSWSEPIAIESLTSAPFWNLVSGAGGSETRGTRTVYARVRDKAGNYSDTVSQTIGFDDIAPELGTPVLEGGAEYTLSAEIGIAWGSGAEPEDAHSGVESIEFSVDGENWTPLEYGPSLVFDLVTAPGATDTDGPKTLRIRVLDAAGNVSEAITDTIILDRLKPSPGTWALSTGSAYTNTGTVSLTASSAPSDAVSGVSQIRFSNDGASWSDWESPVTEKAWDLLNEFGGNGSQGEKLVYVQAKDLAGNISNPASFSATYDSVPPETPPAPDLSAADDTGSSDTDNLTKTSEGLRFTGTTEAGAAVEIRVNGTPAASAVNTGGAWTGTVNLTEGAHEISISVTDQAGNASTSSALTVTVDTTAPTISAPDLAAADDTGTSGSDNLTRYTSGLSFSGTAEAGSTVVLYDDANGLGEAATAAGTWSKDISLAAGTHSITAIATDEAGNSAVSTELSVTVDTTAPTVSAPDLAAADDSGSSSSDNVTKYVSALSVSGTAEIGASITLYNGATSLGSATNASGSWALDIALSEGVHSIIATATDAAGNSADSAALTLTVDTTAPEISAPDLASADDSGSSSADNLTRNTSALTFSGTSGDAISVTLYDGAANLGNAAVSSGSWTADLSLAAGTHAVFGVALDSAGNASTSSALTVTVDTTAPTISAPDLAAADDTGTSSSDNLTRYTSGLSFTGTAETGSTVVLFDGASNLGAATLTSTSWAKDLSLAAGTHSISAQATDAAGNTAASGSLTVSVDTTAPAVTTPDLAAADDSGSSNTDNITKNTAALTFSGTTESGASVVMYNGATSLGAATNTSGTWTKDISLAAGSHSISVYSTDAAGNTAASSALAVTVDTTAPGAPVVTQTTAASVRTPTISWTSGGGGGGGTYYKWSTDAAWTTSTMPGSFTQATALADGSYSFYVWEYDVPWNYAQTTKTITINAPPNAPVLATMTSPTLDSTPTWTWTAGGFGNGNFRYQLDSVSGAWTTTTATTYTPSALSDGNHTLYVEESDAGGEWSAYGSRTVRVTQLIPYNGQTGVLRKPTVEWRSAGLLSTYAVMASLNGSTWTDVATGLTGTSYTLTTAQTLAASTTYYWKVRVSSKAGTTYIPSTGAYTFTTGTK